MHYPRLTCVRGAGVCASVPGCALCGPKSERLHYPRSSSCVTHTLSSPTHVYICHQKRAKNDRFVKSYFPFPSRLACSLSSLTPKGESSRSFAHNSPHLSHQPKSLSLTGWTDESSVPRSPGSAGSMDFARPRLNFTGNCPNWHRRLLVCSVSTIP